MTTQDQESAWQNPVRAKLRERRPVLGVTQTTASLETKASHTGFDSLWIGMENSPITLETARLVILAIRDSGAVPFIRVPLAELGTAERALDMGALGVIFPFVRSAESPRRGANACRYPPVGQRGSGAGLATFCWPAPGGYYDFADQNLVVSANIEEAAAVENIDAIAATPGIDVLFIGVSDLSFSFGLRGAQEHPRMTEAIKAIVAAARREGKAVGRPLVRPQDFERYVDDGFTFFQAQTELGLMAAGGEAYLGRLGKWRPRARNRPMY